ncbi:signal peptidase I [Candidatus Parcubacteria bacterium]|nr:signal peptidase I [Candidatus Parcubacteria bacterium]
MEQPLHSTVEAKDSAVTPVSSPLSPKEKKEPSFLGEFFRFSLIAIIIVVPIRFFVAQPFIVSGASMENTFETGEYLIVDQVTYKLSEPSRGDVIVFHYPKDPSKFYIKRVIGLPGDTVSIVDAQVTITNTEHPEGVVLDEPYIKHMSPAAPSSVTLGTDEYFVMGDNRDKSSDSRIWGVLTREGIVGRAYLRLFPITNAAYLPGTYDINSEVNQ